MYKCDINTLIGMQKYTEAYAEEGILYPFCGNTSVQAYKTLEGIDFRHAYETDEEDNDISPPNPMGESVCCNVWWFTVVDLDKLKSLLNTNNPETLYENRDFTVLDVTPGTYVFTMDYNQKERGLLASGRVLDA